MSTKFEFHVDHELCINHHQINDEVTILEIINHLKPIVYSNDYIDKYNILVDIREATFSDLIYNVSKFSDFFEEISEFRNMQRKCAFLTKKPIDVVNSELVKINFNKLNSNFKIEIFSTEVAALNWLK